MTWGGGGDQLELGMTWGGGGDQLELGMTWGGGGPIRARHDLGMRSGTN